MGFSGYGPDDLSYGPCCPKVCPLKRVFYSHNTQNAIRGGGIPVLLNDCEYILSPMFTASKGSLDRSMGVKKRFLAIDNGYQKKSKVF
jgi:hypothetical protein